MRTGTIFDSSNVKGASHVSQTVLTEQASGNRNRARAWRVQRRRGRRQQHEPLRRRLVRLFQSAGGSQRGRKPYLAAEPPEWPDGARTAGVIVVVIGGVRVSSRAPGRCQRARRSFVAAEPPEWPDGARTAGVVVVFIGHVANPERIGIRNQS